MTLANAACRRGRPEKATGAAGLRPVQVAWLAGSVFIVSAGYGALLPVLPGWLASLMPGVNAAEIARHVGDTEGYDGVERHGIDTRQEGRTQCRPSEADSLY